MRDYWLARCLVLVIYSNVAQAAESKAPDHPSRESIQKANALFEERCKTRAGAKIYRTVKDVDGVVLLKIRPPHAESAEHDLDLPGATMLDELTGESYIETFLGYEHSSSSKGEPVTPTQRGYINTTYNPNNPSNLPGYRYVDVVEADTGKIWRYTAQWYEPWKKDKNYLKGFIQFKLNKISASKSSPRYAVTYEDHVVPEERGLGIASSTVKVLDMKTQEVLGEMTVYAWSKAMMFNAKERGYLSWINASACGRSHASGITTRQFVDQVLIPRREK